MLAFTRKLSVNGIDFAVRVYGDGPRRALLLHGFPDDADSMRPLAELLVARGFTVVAPFMRGYAPTGVAPDGRYDLPVLAADVVGLIAAFGPSATVVGHDWGAVVAYAAAAVAPERVEQVVGVSVPPVGTLIANLRRDRRQARRSAYMLWFNTPVSAWVGRARDLALVDRLWAAWSPDWVPPADRLAEVKATLATPGCLEAALGYYRALRPGVLPARQARWRAAWRLAMAPLARPTVVVHGERDGCIGPALFHDVPCPTRYLPGVGHFVPLEAPEVIAECVK